jgi:hypothetical protein
VPSSFEVAAIAAGAPAEGQLLVQQFLDPAQCAAQGLRIGPGPAQRQHGLERRSDGIRYYLQRFRCISLHSAALHCVPGTVDQPKCSRLRHWSVVERIGFGSWTPRQARFFRGCGTAAASSLFVCGAAIARDRRPELPWSTLS